MKTVEDSGSLVRGRQPVSKETRRGMNVPNARKKNVEVNDISGDGGALRRAAARCGALATRIFYYLISAGVMRHEKSLGRYCRWISRREHAPDAPRPTTGPRRLEAPFAASAARGDIIIRYERVYEAANHSHVHISNGRSPRYSV